jgi:hypothetical protein
MMPNGNYESVIDVIQHRCYSQKRYISCSEYGHDLGQLYYEWEEYNCDDDNEMSQEYSEKINFCPFCGYEPENKKVVEIHRIV